MVSYLQWAIRIEFIVLGLYWIGLAVAITATGLYHELLPLLVVGFHFAAPFAALEVLSFLEERHATQQHPSSSEMTRWIMQGVSALVTDSIGLAYALATFSEAYAEQEALGVANAVFLVLLVVSTMALCVTMIVFWQRHRPQDHYYTEKQTEALMESAHIRSGLQSNMRR